MQMSMKVGGVLMVLSMAACKGGGGDAGKAQDSTAALAVAQCSMDVNDTNKCVNVLEPGWETLPVADKLKRIDRITFNAASYKHAPRKKRDQNCTGKIPKQVARAASKNMDMPDPLTWPVGTRVILAVLGPLDNAGECPDEFYGVGGSANTRYVLLVDIDRVTVPPLDSADVVIGRWTTVAIDEVGLTYRPLRKGNFVACGRRHHKTPQARAEFQNCKQKHELFRLADSLDVNADSLLAEVARWRADTTTVDTPSTRSALLKPELKQQLIALGILNHDNPVWVSCALGCCTAIDPEDPSKLNSTSSGTAIRTSLPTLPVQTVAVRTKQPRP